MIYFKDVLQKKISRFTHKKISLVMLTFSLARFMQANRRNRPHVKNRAQMGPKIALIITAATSISLDKGGTGLLISPALFYKPRKQANLLNYQRNSKLC